MLNRYNTKNTSTYYQLYEKKVNILFKVVFSQLTWLRFVVNYKY